TSSAATTFDSQESATTVRTGGLHLIQHYWGRYVAFLHEPESCTTRVLRDPSGALPCLSTNVEGIEIYVSRLEDAIGLGLQFSISWDYLAAHLCYQRLELNYTGLSELTKVLGGECVIHQHGHRTRALLWNPLRVAESNPIDDPAEAMSAL